MSQGRRKYSPAFKAKVVLEALKDQETVIQHDRAIHRCTPTMRKKVIRLANRLLPKSLIERQSGESSSPSLRHLRPVFLMSSS